MSPSNQNPPKDVIFMLDNDWFLVQLEEDLAKTYEESLWLNYKRKISVCRWEFKILIKKKKEFKGKRLKFCMRGSIGEGSFSWKNPSNLVDNEDHSFSTYAKFSERLTFLRPWYAHVRVFKILVFREILRSY